MEMGDFSQPSDVYKRNSKIDLASALRESISFGRFLSESLDWEKWSAFSHNKHLEEAKNCSVPGSVAQKKAYFEAHYKRSASLKLAAEQDPVIDKSNIGFSCTKAENDQDSKKDDSSCMKAESQEQKNQMHLKTPYKVGENHQFENMEGNKCTPATGVGFHGKHSLQIASSNRVQNNESETIAIDSVCKKQDKNDVSSMSHQDEAQAKKKSATYIMKSVGIHEGSRISSSSALKNQKSMSKENKPPQNRMEISLRSIGSNSILQRGQKASLVNKVSSFYEKVGDSNAACTSSRPSECTSSRASELHQSHIKTPARVSKGGPKHAFLTPQLGYKRTQTPLYETSSARREVDAKFCPISINCFKSPSARENRQLFDRSVSSRSKTIGKIPATKPASPYLTRSNSKSSAETTPLLRSSHKKNKTRQMNV